MREHADLVSVQTERKTFSGTFFFLKCFLGVPLRARLRLPRRPGKPRHLSLGLRRRQQAASAHGQLHSL